jgi:hypothetical protein
VLVFVKTSWLEEVESVIVDLDAEVYFHVFLIERLYLLFEAEIICFTRSKPAEGKFKHSMLFFGFSHQRAEFAAVGILVQPCSLNMAVDAFPLLNSFFCIMNRLMAYLK